MVQRVALLWSFTILGGVGLGACGGGDGKGTEADVYGVGAECVSMETCATYPAPDDGGDRRLECLTDFKGGYCGLEGCAQTADCPDQSICVAHDDGKKYCFRRCADKPECNVNRTLENESNCTSSFDWATPSDDDGSKACIPPSGT